MDSSLKNEVRSCITELESIANKLDSIAYEVSKSVVGMSTQQYILKLEYCAAKYRSAARNLRKIK